MDRILNKQSGQGKRVARTHARTHTHTHTNVGLQEHTHKLMYNNYCRKINRLVLNSTTAIQMSLYPTGALLRSIRGNRRCWVPLIVGVCLLYVIAVRRFMKQSQVTQMATATSRHTSLVETTLRGAGDQVTPLDANEVLQSVVGPLESNGTLSPLFEALEVAAVANRTVMISIVDGKMADFALNLHQTTTLLGLRSVLVCLDDDSRRYLATHQVHCVPFHVEHDAGGEGDFGSRRYLGITNLKTLVVLCALSRGYNVLVVDVDVSLFADPRPHFTCGACDLHVQMDRTQANSGFVHVRHTPASLLLYATAWTLFTRYRRASDQSYLNSAMDILRRGGRLRVQELPADLFSCGYYYFEYDRRQFYNEPPCRGCVMAHNNYIGTVAAKRYRMRENHLWNVDVDGYYTNHTTRYLVYDNTYDLGERSPHFEKAALNNAFHLARLTDRVVILPTFRCCDCAGKVCSTIHKRCSLLTVLDVKRFEEATGGRYREHSFLRHPLVAASVKQPSEVLLINTTFYHNRSVPNVRPLDVFQPAIAGYVNVTLSAWLHRYQSVPVLRFHSLYVSTDILPFKNIDFTNEYFACSSYEQWPWDIVDSML